MMNIVPLYSSHLDEKRQDRRSTRIRHFNQIHEPNSTQKSSKMAIYFIVGYLPAKKTCKRFQIVKGFRLMERNAYREGSSLGWKYM